MIAHSITFAVFSLTVCFASTAHSNESLLAKGNLFYVQEKYEEAIELYSRYLTEVKDTKNMGLVQYLIGNSYLKLNKNRLAAEAFLNIEKIAPSSEWVDNCQLKVADMKAHHSSQISLNGALKIYDDIISRYPQGDCVLMAYFGKGKILYRLERWREAEKRFLEILEMNPPSDLAVEVLLALGDFYRTRGNNLYDIQKAIGRYNEILRKYPQNAPYSSTYLALANSYRESKQYPKAINYYKKIINEYPDSFQAPLAQSMLGLCYEESSKLDESLTAYKSMKKYPTSPLLKARVFSREKKVQRLHKDAIQVEADSSDYEAEQGKANYTGNVKIHWNDCTFSCEKAIANINKSYIRAEGNVVCTSRSDLKITSIYVHFFPKERKAQFYGNVQIYMIEPTSKSENVVARGKKISYNFEDDSYIIED